MELTDSFSPSPDVVAREVDGELVLLHLGSGTYYGINSVGCRIWELLSESDRSIASLCDVISAECAAPRDVVEEDILVLVASLLDEGLVERARA